MDNPQLTDAAAKDPESEAARPGFRPDIEGLRAVAVLAVVLFHASVPGIGGGFVGVDVFFVISGFLIIGMLWREASTSGTVRMRRFYGARARRLLPASAFVGVVTAIGSVLLLPPLLIKTVLLDGIASAMYVSNIWFFLQATDYFTSKSIPSPFEHYWTLGVEEQFYLLAPAVIILAIWAARLVGRRDRARAASSKVPYLTVVLLVVIASFAASVVVTRGWPIAAFFLLPTRAWELAIGGLVALTVSRWQRVPPAAAVIGGWIGLGAVIVACARFSANTPFPGSAALLPVLGAALVIGAGCAEPTRGVGRVLSWPWMRAIGRMSYSWYLWHWPVLIFAPLLVGHPIGLVGRLVTVVISAVLAALTLRLIENPLRFAGPVRRSAGRSLALGGAATAVAVLVGVVLLLVVPAPVGRGPAAAGLVVTVAPPAAAGAGIAAYDAEVKSVFAQVQSAVQASAELKAVPSNLRPPLAAAAAEKAALELNGCMRTIQQVDQPECVTGEADSTTTVALIGDSNAAAWNPALLQMAEQRRWRLESLAKQGCPVMDIPVTALRRQYTECTQWSAQILNRLRAERPQLVVVSISRLYRDDRFRPFDQTWTAGLTRLVQQLRSGGMAVLVLGPIPNPGSVVPICLSAHLDDVTACTPQRSAAVNDAGIAAEAAAVEAAGGRYADVTPLFCTEDRCPVIVGDTLVYLDDFHLTVEYSRLMGPVIGALADRALANG